MTLHTTWQYKIRFAMEFYIVQGHVVDAKLGDQEIKRTIQCNLNYFSKKKNGTGTRNVEYLQI